MIVCKDGQCNFSTLQEAIDSIPEGNTERVIIHIKEGVYKEKVHITKPYITLIGVDPERTILTYDDSANKLLPNGEKMRTFNSYSVFIDGKDFIAENITFENSAGDGSRVGQAVAAYVDGDRTTFRNCKFLGCQDTLFTGPLPPKPIEGNTFGGPKEGKARKNTRQYYEGCYIKGDIDFIFGSATAVFNKCEIFSNNRNMEVNGYITSASTPENNRFGYVFIDCKLTSDGAPNTVYLGRPWRDFAKTIFINCWMGDHIKPEGFHNWDKVHAEKLVDYGEYNSQGPGGQMDQRVSWAKSIKREVLQEYSISNILAGDDGWNPTA
ncbi:pectinesterase family protein [Alkaliphilus transvaalensis]|uniref:pectinesterase family protein n=1 Tax=Alkaliphilus transvaalensis TaxID=114628 RepID=UPI00047A606D|nr:pectinesterase family protein [Alkaliphilus transvaalensis]